MEELAFALRLDTYSERGCFVPVKIMIVNTYYYPDMVGGAEHSVKILAENLQKAGNQVAVFCLNTQKKEFKKDIINGVIIYRSTGGKFNDVGLIKSKKDKLKNYFVLTDNQSIKKEFQSALAEFMPDVVHTNNLPGLTTAVWQVCNSCNIPVIHTLRDYWLCNPWKDKKRNGLQKLPLRMVYHINRRKLLKRSQKISFVAGPSEYIVNRFVSDGYFKNVAHQSVFNCVEIDRPKISECIKLKESRKGEQICFLYAGALTEKKGVMFLLDTFETIQNENISLWICGNGSLEAQVKKYAEKDKRIRFYGKVSSEELAEKYKQSDVLIIPSVWAEPFGRVVIEANMYGNPVIASDVGGIPEIIHEMHFGKLFPPMDSQKLAEIMIYYTDRTHILEDIKNVEENIEKFSAEKQIESYSYIYQKCINDAD